MLSDSNADNAELFEELRGQLDMPLVGCSTMGVMTGRNDVGNLSGALVTLTSDEVAFSTSVSEPLTKDNAVFQIEETYKKALASLGAAPTMILVFLPLIPEIVLDTYPAVLNNISGGLPVFGGVTSSQDENSTSVVFTGDGTSSDQMALVLISGDVKPVFSVKSRLCAIGNIKRTVTHSEDNVIYKVGEQTFVEFIKQFGLEIGSAKDGEDSYAEIISMVPIMIEVNNYIEGFKDVSRVRTIVGLDLEKGSGVMAGEVPQGSTISAVVANTNDLGFAVQDAIVDITSKMKKNEDNGYEYSLLLVVSCASRFIMLGNKNMEADILAKDLPQNVPFCGLYVFGEICPIVSSDDRVLNHAHNYSFTIMAI